MSTHSGCRRSMYFPFLFRSSFVSVCFLLTLVSVSGTISNRFVSGPYTRPYLPDDTIMGQAPMNVITPTHLNGTLVFVPSPSAGRYPFRPPAGSSSAIVRSLLVLPHSLDSRWGCAPFTHLQNDEGQWLNGSILLVERRGGCAFQEKASNAQAAGVLGLAIHNCPYPGCDTVNQNLLRISTTTCDMPVVFIQTDDGYILRNYATARRDWLVRHQANVSIEIPPMYVDPVTVEVMGTGPIVPSEFAALRSIAATLKMDHDLVVAEGELRDWSEVIDRPDVDPCLDRIHGIWCEDGHITSIYLRGLGITGTVDPGWGSFLRLRHLTLTETAGGVTGPVPSSLCNLTELVSFEMEAHALTDVPDCIPHAGLLAFLVGRNRLPRLPSSMPLASDSLVYFVAKSNQFTTLPFDMGLFHQLIYVDLSSNSLMVAPLPSFTGFTSLDTLLLAGCALTGSNLVEHFNQLPSIKRLDLSKNQLSGPLPHFEGVTTLITLSLSTNGFTGSIPATWEGMSETLKTLDLSKNQITGPMENVYSLSVLETLNLGSNLISIEDDVSDNDVGRFLWNWVPPILKKLYMNRNRLSGIWNSGWVLTMVELLDLSHNDIHNMPIDIWEYGLSSLDLSYNTLSGIAPTDINSVNLVSFIKLEGNPNLRFSIIPTWLDLSDRFASDVDALYECPGLYSETYTSLSITGDPQLTNYKDCRCKNGAYGRPPACIPVPAIVTLKYGESGPSIFSDSAYLPQSTGLTIQFTVDLQDVRMDTSNGSIVTGAKVVNSTDIGASAVLQPVRVLTLKVAIATSTIGNVSSTIAVYDVHQNLVRRYTGAEVIALSRSSSGVISPIFYVDIPVFSNKAHLTFTGSGNMRQSYFNATYQIEFICPTGSKLLQANLGWQCMRQLVNRTLVASQDSSYSYLCPPYTVAVDTVDSDSVLSQSLVDPSSVVYLGCECRRGEFGSPPNCAAIPASVIIGPSNVWSPEVAGTLPFEEMIGLNTSTQLAAISDGWYGVQDRLFEGMSTSWTIDLQSLYSSDSSLSDYSIGSSMSSVLVDGDATLQPVRHMVVCLHLSRRYFSSAGDTVSVLDGTAANEAPVRVISGSTITDDICSLQCKSDARFLSSGQDSSQLDVLEPCLIPVIVRSNLASIVFTSRSAIGSERRLFASYSFDFNCPIGEELLGTTDTHTLRCGTRLSSTDLLKILGPIFIGFFILLVGWGVRERYQRQQEKQRTLQMGKPSNDKEEETQKKSQFELEMEKQHIWQLEKELMRMVITMGLELTFCTMHWIQLGEQIRDSSYADDTVQALYMSFIILLTIAYICNTVTRVVTLRALIEEYQESRQVGLPVRGIQHQLQKVQRQIMQVKITSLALMFDSVPLTCLNAYKLSLDLPSGVSILRVCLGAFLIGINLSRFVDLPELKTLRLKLQYQIFLEKASMRERNASMMKTTTMMGNRKFSQLQQPPQPNTIDTNSDKPQPTRPRTVTHIDDSDSDSDLAPRPVSIRRANTFIYTQSPNPVNTVNAADDPQPGMTPTRGDDSAAIATDPATVTLHMPIDTNQSNTTSHAAIEPAAAASPHLLTPTRSARSFRLMRGRSSRGDSTGVGVPGGALIAPNSPSGSGSLSRTLQLTLSSPRQLIRDSWGDTNTHRDAAAAAATALIREVTPHAHPQRQTDTQTDTPEGAPADIHTVPTVAPGDSHSALPVQTVTVDVDGDCDHASLQLVMTDPNAPPTLPPYEPQWQHA